MSQSSSVVVNTINTTRYFCGHYWGYSKKFKKVGNILCLASCKHLFLAHVTHKMPKWDQKHLSLLHKCLLLRSPNLSQNDKLFEQEEHIIVNIWWHCCRFLVAKEAHYLFGTLFLLSIIADSFIMVINCVFSYTIMVWFLVDRRQRRLGSSLFVLTCSYEQ